MKGRKKVVACGRVSGRQWTFSRGESVVVQMNFLTGHLSYSIRRCGALTDHQGYVSGAVSTSVALSKRLSTFFEDNSEAGQPTSHLIRPSRRCSIEPSAGILISQRWPFSSVRSKQELIVDRLSHKWAVKKKGRREMWNSKS